jgi:hypothetical protein
MKAYCVLCNVGTETIKYVDLDLKTVQVYCLQTKTEGHQYFTLDI